MKSRTRRKPRLTIIVAGTLILWGLYGGYYLWRLNSTWREGKRLYESGNYIDAAKAFRDYSSLIPEEAEGHYWLGNALGLSNRLEEATSELRRAAQLAPRNTEYQLSLGIALQSLKRNAEAEQIFRQALTLQFNNSDLHVWLGYSLDKQKRRVEAIREWRQALQIDPGNRGAQKALRRVQGQSDEPL
jgi:Flp pilus assembly protein TadD